jgi:hypothetical protein
MVAGAFEDDWRRGWDLKTPANVSSTTYRATDGSFDYGKQCKAIVTAGEWQVFIWLARWVFPRCSYAI